MTQVKLSPLSVEVQNKAFAKLKNRENSKDRSSPAQPCATKLFIAFINKRIKITCTKKNCAFFKYYKLSLTTRTVELLSSGHIKHFAIDSHEDPRILHSVILLQVLQSEVSLLQFG